MTRLSLALWKQGVPNTIPLGVKSFDHDQIPGSLCYRGGPCVILILCCFVVFSSGRFMLSPALLFVLV